MPMESRSPSPPPNPKRLSTRPAAAMPIALVCCGLQLGLGNHRASRLADGFAQDCQSRRTKPQLHARRNCKAVRTTLRQSHQAVMMSIWGTVASAIRDATHRPFVILATTPVGGGSINEAYHLDGTDGARYFLKLNESRHLPMFVAEATGLKMIAATDTIRVP